MCTPPFAPIVVAKMSFLGQTSTIATTTIYTPSAEGDFVVYISADSSGVTGAGQIQTYWTTDNGAGGATLDFPGGSTCCSRFQVSTFHSAASEPIQIEVTSAPDDSYNLYVTVEQH